METTLGGERSRVFVRDDASLAWARSLVRESAAAAGLGAHVAAEMALVATELGRNQLRHAVAGEIAVAACERGEVRGIEVVATDRGPGFADPAGMLARGRGLGVVRRLASEVDFDLRVGEGTTIRARRFAVEPPWRVESAILGRPATDETISGDDALVVESPAGILVAVADGLGHGRLARDASFACVEEIGLFRDRAPDALLARCDAHLQSSPRGAALTIVRVDPRARTATHASLGNVSAWVFDADETRRFGCGAGVVGEAARHRHVATERLAVPAGALLVVASDGLSTKLTLDGAPALLRAHPVEVAQFLLERFAHAHDDSIVAVLR